MTIDPTTDAMKPEMSRIAVVVIGRNEAAHLSECLASVASMSYPAALVEMIYVDSASTDGSPEIAETAGAHVIRLTGAPMNAARGRNAGWQAARAPYILFLDGDVTLEKEFVGRSLSHFLDPSVLCVSGVLRETRPTASIYNRVFDLDWVKPFGDSETFGGIVLVRRDALELAGGYNETLGAGEEPELSRRLRSHGGRILHTNEPMALHDLAMTRWQQYWGRMVRTGYAYAQVSSMYAKTSDPLWLRESRANRTRGMIFLALPVVVLLVCAASGSLWPLLVAVLAGIAFVLRTAWRARHRANSWKTLLLFGVHSHFQQIPILLGQWRYWRSAPKRHTGSQFSSEA